MSRAHRRQPFVTLELTHAQVLWLRDALRRPGVKEAMGMRMDPAAAGKLPPKGLHCRTFSAPQQVVNKIDAACAGIEVGRAVELKIVGGGA